MRNSVVKKLKNQFIIKFGCAPTKSEFRKVKKNYLSIKKFKVADDFIPENRKNVSI